MIFELISLFDKKAEVYSPPMYYTHRAYMNRDLQKLVSSGQGAYSLHPDDFTVVLVGTFDDRTGNVIEGDKVLADLSQFRPVQ